MASEEPHDVVVLGGGLAGLTLALQLKRSRPQTTILVAERNEHPVPEAAFKVGESTIEAGTNYLAEVLDLKEHLKSEQLPKLGLRYFFPYGENDDIARRVEVGPQFFPPIPSYQLDRGRFENMLGKKIVEHGVEFLDSCKVNQVKFGSDNHSATLNRNGSEIQVSGRWIVDATGRSCVLKRQFDLAQTNDIDHNAAWFRVGEEVAVDDWSDDPKWRSRVSRRRRRFSTNHLMGPGYWVWLIPLASGSHSIGIITDPSIHPFSEINTFERALDWLRRHEPQCADAIEQRRDKLQDFRVLKHYSHGCKQVFSGDRWCLTGEAGVFLDPFYSVGTDFIGFSNSLITDLICRDLDGEPIEKRAEALNRTYLWRYTKTQQWYRRLMPIWGNAQVMTAKTVWDFATYWGVLALLDFHRKWADVEFIASLEPQLQRLERLDEEVQAFFLEWAEQEQRQWCDGFASHAALDFVRSLGDGLVAELDDDRLRTQVEANLDLCDSVAAEMRRKAAGGRASAADAELAADLSKIWMDLVAVPAQGQSAGAGTAGNSGVR